MPEFPFDAILFDCDGVLVDSEPITCRVLAEMLGELGWPISVHETMERFIGKMVKDQAALIQEQTGFALTEDWLAGFRARRDDALARELVAVPGAKAAVDTLSSRLRGRIAVASGADRGKILLQLRKTGLLPSFESQVYSGQEMPRSKPFPDVYLAAANGLGVAPRRCAVVEDTVTGATAGVAAGATVFGYSPPEAGHSGAEALLAVGAVAVFTDMRALPDLLAGHEFAERPG
ncbi:MAG: HAD family phosphatase [Pigmentiphaga sp.]|nr:HAD family phosphatase [Pigmentiphaga sp.]